MEWSGTHRIPVRASLTIVLAGLFASLAIAETKLTVQTVRLPENAQIEITCSATKFTSDVANDLDKRSDLVRTDTKNHRFRLYIDLSNIRPFKDAYYLYD